MMMMKAQADQLAAQAQEQQAKALKAEAEALKAQLEAEVIRRQLQTGLLGNASTTV
jgi:hypothetical protein